MTDLLRTRRNHQGRNVKPPIPLAGSSVQSVRRIDRAVAKAHYVDKRVWVAEIEHEGLRLILASRLPDLAWLGVVTGWVPPTRWPSPVAD
jgi:hypothetical protein